MEPLIFEISVPGRRCATLPAGDVPDIPLEEMVPQGMLREMLPDLPEVSELDLARHFTRLSHLNHAVDVGFYPLGSCTMKYNPKINEDIANYPGLALLHPYQPEDTVQGALQIMFETSSMLAEITGMDEFTLQPAAGAQGELAGMMMIRAYHDSRGDDRRTKVIVPDSAHGTNPASAALCGFEVVEVQSDQRGGIDLDALRRAAGAGTAALMLTNPNTLGLFEEQILPIAEIIHQAGGLLYYDGANLNAIMGKSRPGDMGFDVIHVNLHKTFGAPHGSGGPGSGPVGVKELLAPFLPVPVVGLDQALGMYYLDYHRPRSIGRVKSFYGNFGVVIKAYAYIRTLGGLGLTAASEYAVLNANFLMRMLARHYHLPFDRHCKHEFVVTPANLKETGVHALDIGKRMMDYGLHPPTVYFPLIVEEAMMFEPTETESPQTLEHVAGVMETIAGECRTNPEIVLEAPHVTELSRLDEAAAARKPNLRYRR